jgi:hypothetical protein
MSHTYSTHTFATATNALTRLQPPQRGLAVLAGQQRVMAAAFRHNASVFQQVDAVSPTHRGRWTCTHFNEMVVTIRKVNPYLPNVLCVAGTSEVSRTAIAALLGANFKS